MIEQKKWSIKSHPPVVISRDSGSGSMIPGEGGGLNFCIEGGTDGLSGD